MCFASFIASVSDAQSGMSQDSASLSSPSNVQGSGAQLLRSISDGFRGGLASFSGELLFRASTKLFFHKWKRVLVTLQENMLMIHNIDHAVVAPRTALKIFYLHPFMALEALRITQGAVVDKSRFQNGRIVRQVSPPCRIHRTKLLENPLNQVQRNVFIRSKGHFISTYRSVDVKVVFELGSIQREDIVALLDRIAGRILMLQRDRSSH
jgi:hypothetical protein